MLEAAADGGALKTARKGTSNYEMVVHGRAAHAGLNPEKGANAAIELAHQVLAIEGVAALVNGDGTAAPAGADGARTPATATAPGTAGVPAVTGAGTTVTPTVLSAGTTANTVPALARVAVDVRSPTLAAQRRVDALIRALPRLAGTRLEVLGGPNRPPMEASSSAGLFALAQRVAADLGLDPLTGIGVGGGPTGTSPPGWAAPLSTGWARSAAGPTPRTSMWWWPSCRAVRRCWPD
nr:hypothetical protein GCM10020093_014050 [Planobispora longispora]